MSIEVFAKVDKFLLKYVVSPVAMIPKEIDVARCGITH